ncbi:SDR family NAD(P)-dependent oxidoreductase [Telmatospirillum sp. J64-1]|uniref:SDR family NAD(P)-dependent oxidoreductase n=1 Tax=Telmatospirillum sp. J64-1 TaxID=2502183 RepID=UPI00115E302E|nr:3-oxoacyl-ACP reductase family protein [Telmatospirillum sp. J64-1]
MASTRPLEGKVALVTGASRGIGWATARLLAERGASVIVNGMEMSEALEAKAEALSAEFGTPCIALAADLAEPDQVKAMYKQVFTRFRRLDLMVNNAGILGDALIGMISDDMIDRVLRVNLHGGLHSLQQAARLMRRNPGGAIVNVSSIIGTAGNAGQAVYGASKAGLIGLTKSAAKELAPQNIRVNAVAPGFIETDMIGHLDDETRAARLAGIAMGRPGSAEDVARVILFLLSDEASYVTGQIIGVDGGMVI